MKKLILTVLLLLPLVTQAAEKLLENKAIKSSVIEASSYLKHEFSKELKQSVGLNEFVLKVELNIDEKKLQDSLGVIEEDWSKYKDMQLPGLFVEGKEGMAISPLRQAKKEDILMNIKSIKVDLVYHQNNYTPEFLTTALKRIVLFSVFHLKDHQIEIVPKLEAASYRVTTPQPEEAISKALSKHLNVNITQNEFQNFWNEFHKPILIGSAALLLVLGLIMAFSLKGGLGSLAEVIKSKTFTSQAPQRQAPAAAIETAAHQPRPDFAIDTFESYIQATEYLSIMIKKEPKVFNEVIVLKLLAEDFVALTILLDVLPKDKRESFLANIDQEKKERFKEFIVGQAISVLKDEGLLKAEAIKMIKLVKVASLSPDELYLIVITDLISGLNNQDLKALMKSTVGQEKSFICDLLDAQQLAYLVQNESISPEDIDFETPELSKSEMVDVLIKASSIRGFKKTKVRKDKLEIVYAQVETDKAEVLADAMGLEPHLRFEFLFTTFKEAALNYMERLDFENMSLLFPLLTQNMRDEVMTQLPELLAERLKFAKKKINGESLKLKGDFYFYLRSLSDSEESFTDGLKLVA